MTGRSAFERDLRNRVEHGGALDDHIRLEIEIGVLRGILHDLDLWRRIGETEIDLIEPQEIVLADKTDDDIKKIVADLMSENAMLFEVVRNDITKWSFDALMTMAKRLLDEVYPASQFIGGPDSSDGVRFVVALRAVIEEIEREREPTATDPGRSLPRAD